MYHKKKTIYQILDEINFEQKFGSCFACGSDALCEYDSNSKMYLFNCQNETCFYHWPPYKTQNRDHPPDWFVWPLP